MPRAGWRRQEKGRRPTADLASCYRRRLRFQVATPQRRPLLPRGVASRPALSERRPAGRETERPPWQPSALLRHPLGRACGDTSSPSNYRRDKNAVGAGAAEARGRARRAKAADRARAWTREEQ
ncbi:hypothetical protein AAFF_G00213280 [Aldrovandia affinis]|uniref:Uncharacterized protein n=1 Tax=Aldrovandia affinis TaxID=143900 RepID=A0AAD7RGW1_9TELE|nr:hypothetical protein AAFF_G00213280 [Aldrovandia affinis]